MYAVAGVTGRVGSVVAHELLSQGSDVRVIVRQESQAPRWGGRGAEVSVGSLADAAFLTRALEGTSGFFSLLPEDLSVPDFHGHRRRITEAIVASVMASRIPHVVLHSALAAALPEGNGPAKELHHLENELRSSDVTLTANRACYLQENVAAAVQPAKEAGIYPNLFPSADMPFPTIATLDVGRFAARALTEPPARSEIVDLLGPEYSIRELAECLGKLLGKKLQIVDIPPEGQVEALTSAGLPQVFAEAVAELFVAFAAGRVRPQGDRTLRGTTTIDETLGRTLGLASSGDA